MVTKLNGVVLVLWLQCIVGRIISDPPEDLTSDPPEDLKSDPPEDLTSDPPEDFK